MIHTDGIRTIAHRPPTASQRIRQARALREAALDAEVLYEPLDVDGFVEWLAKRDRSDLPASMRGGSGAANGQQWNDDVCACGGEIIADSPAGDKCWDCFNHEPGE